MTMISATDTVPVITHPAWCDPKRCHVERLRGVPTGDVYHWSTTVKSRGLGLALARVDRDGAPTAPTVVYVIDGRLPDELTVDGLELIGQWLVERAGEYRAAIKAEAGR